MIYKKPKRYFSFAVQNDKTLVGLLISKTHKFFSKIAIDYAMILGLKLSDLDLLTRVCQLFWMTRYQLENENFQIYYCPESNVIIIDIGLMVAKSCFANYSLDLKEDANQLKHYFCIQPTYYYWKTERLQSTSLISLAEC